MSTQEYELEAIFVLLNLKFFAALDECTAGDLVTGALVAAFLLCGASPSGLPPGFCPALS
jgi:hypothetical protein